MSTNLKNFLKPTKGKLVVFVLIFFLTIFLHGIVVKLEAKALEIVERILSPHQLWYRYITPLPPDPAGILIHPYTILLAILGFIAGLIYWYLISCLIIFIYERLKEKLRKR